MENFIFSAVLYTKSVTWIYENYSIIFNYSNKPHLTVFHLKVTALKSVVQLNPVPLNTNSVTVNTKQPKLSSFNFIEKTENKEFEWSIKSSFCDSFFYTISV